MSDPIQRHKDELSVLRDNKQLCLTLNIPDAAAPLEIVADLARRCVDVGMTLRAPEDRKSSAARVNWLLRQIKQDNVPDLYMRLIWPGTSTPTQHLVSDLRNNIEIVNECKEHLVTTSLHLFESKNLGGRFSQQSNFIADLEQIVPAFYGAYGANLAVWKKPAPKLKSDILLRLNWPEFSVGTESIYRSALSSRSLHFVGMNDAKISITLSEEERTALEAVCRRRKVEALVWKRARAFLLLDAGEDARTVCRILDIGPTVLTEWKSAFAAMGLSFFGLKDYSPRQGHLSFAQEAELKAHFSNTPPRNADEVCAHILAEYGQSYCSSGAAKLMSRLGFEYRKPQVLPTRAAEAAQEAFIAAYEALMRRLDDDEMVVFSDAVHPTHQSRPAHGWFPKDQKTAIKASSGRKRLNIQGAIDLETFQFTFVEAEKINARTTRQMLEKLELANPSMTAIHVFVDNARYHHAKVLQPWLNAPDRRVKLHFLPPYAPHLNPIERLWGVMHKWVTHNRHYATFNQFADAIMGFFRQTLPDKWHEFRDTVTDNFRVISLRKYKLI